MITNSIIDLVTTVVGFFDSFLPHLSPPTWFSTGSGTVGGTVASWVGGSLSVLQPLLPVDPLLTVLYAVLALFPVWAAYVVFQWVWAHVPIIAGFGTGGGGG